MLTIKSQQTYRIEHLWKPHWG